MNRRELFRRAVGGASAIAVFSTLPVMPDRRMPRPRRTSVADTDASFVAGENAVLMWDAAALQAIRDTKPGPPMVARALAILHTCMYDAWAAFDPVAVGTRLGADIRRPTTEHTAANKQAAVSFAAYRALVDLFPTTPAFGELMAAQGYSPDDTNSDPTTPAGVGNVCAAAVIDWRHGDGSNQLGDLHPGPYSDYTGYQPVNTPDEVVDPNRWQPLSVFDPQKGFVVQQYIGPHWGLVTPFALASGTDLRPAVGPATYPSEAYRIQAEQMLEYSANLTDEQKVITEYFADGPSSELPPGHWCLFARFVSLRDGNDLDADVKMFFAMTNALMDAGIAAWDTKRLYDSVRPITAVRFLFKGEKVRAWGGPFQSTQLVDGGTWQLFQSPSVVTPAFPEYVSGHSTFSAAAAEILRRFTGSDDFGASYTQAAGSSRFEPGAVPATDVTLTWKTFSDAADQAGLSRRYGGIHFPDGDLQGRAMGRAASVRAWDKAQAYITGDV